MSTISASTTSTTGFKVTSDTTGTLVFQTGASPTTAMSISSAQIISFTNPPTATGGGSVATNTSYGTSALAANTTGANNFAAGYQALQANTTANQNTAVGSQAAYSNTTGSSLEAFGYQALYSNTTGNYNSAFGFYALQLNTTGSRNSAFSRGALAANTTGGSNVSMGVSSLNASTTGSYNTALGDSALGNSTTASNNTAVGYQAGVSNTTGALNVFVGPTAGLQNTTGAANVAIGGGTSGVAWSALQENRTSSYNTMVGVGAGGQYNSSGGLNTFIGYYAGNEITSGSKNTIIGRFGGNSGGLDIRTSSNYIVLSDGDGNPRAISTNNGTWLLAGKTSADGTSPGVMIEPDNGATSGRINIVKSYNGTTTAMAFYYSGAGVGTISYSNTATAYNTSSDYRLKENIAPMTGALATIAQLNPVTYKWKSDGSDGQGFIAHELQAVVPDAVTGEKDAVDEDGNPVYQGIDTSFLVATLVAAIKELKAEIDTLKGQA